VRSQTELLSNKLSRSESSVVATNLSLELITYCNASSENLPAIRYVLIEVSIVL